MTKYGWSGNEVTIIVRFRYGNEERGNKYWDSEKERRCKGDKECFYTQVQIFNVGRILKEI